MQKKKFDLSGTAALIIAILVLLVFIPINIIVSYYDKVYDMTPSGKYTLTPTMEKVLDETKDKQIDIYFLSPMSDLKEIASGLPLYHTLTQLKERDNITLTAFDPDKEADLAKSLDPNNIFGTSVGDVFIKCGDLTRKISLEKIFQKDQNGEFAYGGEEYIAGAIQSVAGGTLPVVYFIEGYSDKTLEANYYAYADEIKADNYDVRSLYLDQAGEIPDDAAIVYLAGIDRDLSDADRDKLGRYVDNGGALSVLIGPSDTKGRFTNLEFILSKFELTINYDRITESNTINLLQNRDYEQDPSFFRVSYPAFSEEEYTVDLTTELNTEVSKGTYIAGISNARSVSSLGTDSAYIEKASIIENLPSSADSYEYTVVSTPMGGDDETAKDCESLTGAPIEMGYYSINKQTGAKLILIGSDDFINVDSFFITTYGTRMLTLFSNTWLYNSDVDMGIGIKTNSYDRMTFSSGEEASGVMRIFTVIPALLLVAGVAVWLKRRYA
ncbi:MAG: Gldg family protein [Ruminococcus sp.]|nr:Gldg family protein [Ruminococcus sp.]